MASSLRRKARAGLGVLAELYIPEHLKTYQPTRRFTVAVSEGGGIETWEAQIHEEKIGDLTLATGKLIATDPAYGRFPEDITPFTRTVPPGTYSVVLGMVDEYTSRHYASNVYALICFSDNPIIHWELALCPEQNADELEGMQYFGFGVDSGTGCFLDEGLKYYLAQEEVQRLMGDVMTGNGDITLTMERGARMVVFIAGMGDGCYPCYWGLDTQDQPVCLLADFQILRSLEELLSMGQVSEPRV
ncbi:DUF4241 domain-containing protein [Armatimonas rosea]|uniref:DUF4241 domain-containing protein n=1 Tax=Armatimonas rosea TaxID=685828 RepID=A0A7W9SRQ0_ARMRO|nr:DUF4241 domain-containing protein [Armatimonas rosea]MBB6050833.1 hypothetical protein [Armatimonas rosea]